MANQVLRMLVKKRCNLNMDLKEKDPNLQGMEIGK